MSATSNRQRFTASSPCPICGGHSALPAGRGLRCAGYREGDYAYCTREEHAGNAPFSAATQPPTYRHWMGPGNCHCGPGINHSGQPATGAKAAYEGWGNRRETRRREWPIRHPDGKLFAVHHRTDYANGSRKMWWPTGTKSGQAPMYRSETLADLEPGATVILCEGEPDTDATVAAGFVALGTVCGAETEPPDSALVPLKRFRMVLWPDADDETTTPAFAGQKHMERIARRLAAWGVDVRIVDWLDAPPKGGAKDYFATHSPEDFAELLAAAKPYQQEAEPGDAPTGPQPVDWPAFWAADHKAEDWLLEPIIPRGRSVSLYATAKTGKSLLALDLAARLATGRRVLDRPAGSPVSVVYLDFEMTEDDLAERLEDLGYGPEDDLSRFSYYLLPSLPPLDTVAGGEALRAIVALHNPELVIIDTTSRVISGEENSADTLRALYVHSILPLKAAGIAVVRLDHSGKDATRGQRGTSAKADDVDVVWELTPRDGGLRLRATHRRQSWVPEVVDLVRLDAPLRHERAAESWPSGTLELAEQLDALGVAVDASRNACAKALRAAGITARNDVISAAVRWRKTRGTPRETPFDGEWGTPSGNTSDFESGEHAREQREHPSRTAGNVSPHVVGNVTQPQPEDGLIECANCGWEAKLAGYRPSDLAPLCPTCYTRVAS